MAEDNVKMLRLDLYCDIKMLEMILAKISKGVILYYKLHQASIYNDKIFDILVISELKILSLLLFGPFCTVLHSQTVPSRSNAASAIIFIPAHVVRVIDHRCIPLSLGQW